jgi:hypothetical protein
MIIFFNFFFDALNKINDSFLEIIFGTRHEQMIKAATNISLDGLFDIGPFAIAYHVSQVKQNCIGLFAEKFRLLRCVQQINLINWEIVLPKFLGND